MLVPVYGFEDSYKIDENGNLFSKKDNYTKSKRIAPQASHRQDRYRLSNRKYYDAKYLVYKSFNPTCDEVEINDERIIFIDGDVRNNNIANLKMINNFNRNEISKLLSQKYSEQILPIKDYKNYYVSENGNIYSYYRSTSRILKNYKGTDGYLQVKVPDNFGATVHLKIHKIVAKTFIKNPNNFQVVHHKDENKLNNNVKNLEWTTLKQNTIYSVGKKCCMVDENNCILSIHEAISELSRYYRVDSSTASKQCNGKKNCFTNGMKARFFDEKIHNFIATDFD